MPLFYQHTSDNFRLGVWRITEEETFFKQIVPLQRSITHPHKRLQHLAGRYLLQHLHPAFPTEMIRIADTRKPYLADESVHFSISHCGAYAAAIISGLYSVGIDIELIKPMIEIIRHKFLSGAEMLLLTDRVGNYTEPGVAPLKLYTICWCAKEAVYKWYGKGGIDFKDHIRLMAVSGLATGRNGTIQVLFTKEEAVTLTVHYMIMDACILAWVVC